MSVPFSLSQSTTLNVRHPSKSVYIENCLFFWIARLFEVSKCGFCGFFLSVKFATSLLASLAGGLNYIKIKKYQAQTQTSNELHCLDVWKYSHKYLCSFLPQYNTHYNNTLETLRPAPITLKWGDATEVFATDPQRGAQ